MPNFNGITSTLKNSRCISTSAHDTCTLSLSSSTEEIKRYFKAILELSKSNLPYPANLDSCWMLCYSEKGKATRALKENFIEGIAPTIGNNHFSYETRICDKNIIRRLTPAECARLQTIPEWYKWRCSDTQIYKMLGNGWTVDVIAHILSFMNIDNNDIKN